MSKALLKERIANSASRVRLGDKAERLFKPIARLINVEGCAGCKKRRDWLNGESGHPPAGNFDEYPADS